jgi:uncharacterized protein YdeI (YjbR/CyaY-like superfamily)
MKPWFFATPAQFRAWLEEHHEDARELFVGFYKKDSGRPSITWPEAVDEALCFGWIDGVRRSLDDTSYVNRFTPRRRGSNWSALNVKRVGELKRQGRMKPSGLRVFEERRKDRTALASYEQKQPIAFDPAYERRLRSNRKASAFFESQTPSYRKAAIWWVMSAKKEETRERRLATLIEDSAGGRTVPPLTTPARRT